MNRVAELTAGAVLTGKLAGLARAAMTRPAYDYCAGAAGDEATVARNVAALDARLLTPRVLAPPAGPGALRVAVPGGHLDAPVLVAPMGLQALCCPAAEVASAAAAASLGLGFCLSMFSSRPVEEVAAHAGPGLRWQQIYLLRDRGVTDSMVARAVAASASALVVTVDVPVVGRRTRDLRNRFDRFASAAPAIVADPCFRRLLASRDGAAGDGTTSDGVAGGGVAGGGAAGDGEGRLLAELFPNPGATWSDVERLVRRAGVPVLVKGVLDAGDARLAVAAGAAGVIVSNHGGRQFDRCIAAIDGLAPVVDAVGGEVPVLFDSGIRRGSHMAVALALGARAVLVGRPVLWGLAVAGEAGARLVLRTLVDDLAHVRDLVGPLDCLPVPGLPIPIPNVPNATAPGGTVPGGGCARG